MLNISPAQFSDAVGAGVGGAPPGMGHQMPRHKRALTRAARRRARARGLSYQQALQDVLEIRDFATYAEVTWEEAEAEYDDLRNELLCERCGWTVAEACPECPSGCGCNNGWCTGWRHAEYATDEERDDLAEAGVCEECGGDLSHGSSDRCQCG